MNVCKTRFFNNPSVFHVKDLFDKNQQSFYPASLIPVKILVPNIDIVVYIQYYQLTHKLIVFNSMRLTQDVIVSKFYFNWIDLYLCYFIKYQTVKCKCVFKISLKIGMNVIYVVKWLGYHNCNRKAWVEKNNFLKYF